MSLEVNGILGLLLLFFNILAVVKIIQSGATTVKKALWILLILILPILGLVIWYFLGPKG